MGKSETLLAFIKDRPGHDRRYALNCKKAGEELGWKPTIPLDEGLRQTIKWYESNADLLARVHAGELLPPLTPMLRAINTIGFTQSILPTQ